MWTLVKCCNPKSVVGVGITMNESQGEEQVLCFDRQMGDAKSTNGENGAAIARCSVGKLANADGASCRTISTRVPTIEDGRCPNSNGQSQ